VNQCRLRLGAAEAGNNQRQMFRLFHLKPPLVYVLKYLSIRSIVGKRL
jgi:hypothetical protein